MTHHTVLKYTADGESFELLIHLDKVKKFRDNPDSTSMGACLFSDDIYLDVATGKSPSDSALEKVFGTTDPKECIRYILLNATLPVTTAERKKLNEQMLARIVHHFNMHYVDPSSNRSHPETRIRNAIEQLKYHVDYTVNLDRHISTLEKKFPGILALKKLELAAVLTLPNQHLGKVFGSLSKSCSLGKTDYGADNAVVQLTCSPGERDQLFSLLNKLTQGDFDLVFEGDSVDISSVAAEKSADLVKRGKKKKKKGQKSKSSHTTTSSSSPSASTSSSATDTRGGKKKRKKGQR